MIYVIENIYHLIQRLKNNPNKVIVLKCYMPWCGYCKKIEPEYLEMSRRFPDVIFIELNMETDKINGSKVSEAFKISGFPTFLIFKDEDLKEKIVGANMELLQDKIYDYK